MATKPRRTRAPAWMRILEQSTRSRDPEGAREARRLFKALGAERQQALTQEISDTRASELCRAYPNVISRPFSNWGDCVKV